VLIWRRIRLPRKPPSEWLGGWWINSWRVSMHCCELRLLHPWGQRRFFVGLPNWSSNWPDCRSLLAPLACLGLVGKSSCAVCMLVECSLYLLVVCYWLSSFAAAWDARSMRLIYQSMSHLLRHRWCLLASNLSTSCSIWRICFNARRDHLVYLTRVGSVWTGKERELHLQYVHRLCTVKSIAIFLITSFEPVYPK